MALLGDAIGAELLLESTERAVGPFRADLLCKDVSSDTWVLIENQIERTDHGHLGQLLTYAAGLSAVTIVWIAQRFTDEHRAALDWLNEVTSEEIALFGLEVELWRIGDSVPAPKFNVVSRPNTFVKRQVAERSAASSNAGAFYTEYWTAFCDSLRAAGSRFGTRTSSGDNWIAWSAGRSGFGYCCLVSRPKKRVTARIFLPGSTAKDCYRQLLERRDDLDAALPGLSWEPRPTNVESYISLYLDGADPNDRTDWPRQHDWLRARLDELDRVFGPVIRQLP